MEEQISEKERLQRSKAIAAILSRLVQGLGEGKWRELKFMVRQHRTERRDALNHLYSVGRSKLELTLSLDVDEEEFMADMSSRRADIAIALRPEVDRAESRCPHWYVRCKDPECPVHGRGSSNR